MRTADTPYRRGSAAARGWRTFRRWRRGRPFWGGLLTILSGVVFFLSGHITLGGVKVTFGPQEFLGWVIPLILLLCGLLMLVTPGQRIFYGVLAAAVSVGGLIGLNLGGFVVGMLLGMVGGALGASWTPVTLPPAAPPDEPPSAEEQLFAEEQAESAEQLFTEEQAESAEQPGSAARGWFPSGPLTDTLPTSMTSPLAVPPGGSGSAAEPGGGTGDAGEHGNDRYTGGPGAGPLPPRSPRGLAVLLLVMTTLAVGLAVARVESPAAAAPSCDSTASAAAGFLPAAASAGKPPAAKTLGAKALGAQVIDSVIGGVGRLLGMDIPADPSASPSPSTTGPAPSATPTPSASVGSPAPSDTATPSATPTPSANPTGTRPTAGPTATPSAAPSCPVAGTLIAPGDQTVVNQNPSLQITAALSQVWLTYDGVTELRTVGGTIRVLQFSMDSSTSTPFELRVPVSGHTLAYRSSQLTVSGNVRFYTTKLQGNLGGAVPQTYTPDSPPPLPAGLPVPALVFTDATLELVLVRADKLTAPGLTIAYIS